MPQPHTNQNVEQLRHQFPTLPDDYFHHLSKIGWGETNGRMIYEGPIYSDEIYGQIDELNDIVLLGDDFQGYCLGYNLITSCYGEVTDSGTWEAWPSTEGIEHYFDDPEKNAT